MFDVSWSELLILAVVTLIFVGPKELPVFLGTLGRYAGAIRKQASEFRRHFDDAMREAELDQVRKDVETMAREVNESVMAASRDARSEVEGIKNSIGGALPSTPPPAPAPLPAPVEATAPAPVEAAEVPPPKVASGHG